MKSLKLFAVVAIFGAFLTACEAESLNEDQVQIEEIEVISGTGNESTELSEEEDDDDN